MRSFFEPVGPDVPVWLKSILTSIRLALKDPFDWPIRLWKVPTADLPTPDVAGNEGAILYDSTTNSPKFSDGSSWFAFQLSDAQLDAIAGLTPAADQTIYWTSATAAAMTGLTSFGRSLIDDADATAARTTLGLGTAAVRNTGTSGTTVPLLDGANTHSGTVTINTATTQATNITGNRSLASWGQSGPNLRVSANTLTNTTTAEAGTVAVQTSNSLAQPTFASSNNITVTNATTFYIDDAPAAGGGTTIGSAWALYVAAGASRFAAITATGNCTFGDNVGDAHTFTGNVTITESTGNVLIVKDSADSGSAALLTIDFQGADGVSVGSISKSSASNSNFDVTSVGGDVRILTTNALQATFDTDGLNLVSGNWYEINGTQVVRARITGWGAMTGTAARGAAAVHAAQTITSPPTQAEVQNIDNSLVIVAQRLKALIDDLTTHGLIGA